MDPNEQLDLIIKSTAAQIDAANKSLENNIDAADRIHARQASQSLVKSAAAILSDPTSATL